MLYDVVSVIIYLITKNKTNKKIRQARLCLYFQVKYLYMEVFAKYAKYDRKVLSK